MQSRTPGRAAASITASTSSGRPGHRICTTAPLPSMAAATGPASFGQGSISGCTAQSASIRCFICRRAGIVCVQLPQEWMATPPNSRPRASLYGFVNRRLKSAEQKDWLSSETLMPPAPGAEGMMWPGSASASGPIASACRRLNSMMRALIAASSSCATSGSVTHSTMKFEASTTSVAVSLADCVSVRAIGMASPVRPLK